MTAGAPHYISTVLFLTTRSHLALNSPSSRSACWTRSPPDAQGQGKCASACFIARAIGNLLGVHLLVLVLLKALVLGQDDICTTHEGGSADRRERRGSGTALLDSQPSRTCEYGMYSSVAISARSVWPSRTGVVCVWKPEIVRGLPAWPTTSTA